MRLSADWQAHYAHPIELLETFVDPEQFSGTAYTAQGWIELGHTDAWSRHSREYQVKHDKPKRLFVRKLSPTRAAILKPSLAMIEAKVPPLRVAKTPSGLEMIGWRGFVIKTTGLCWPLPRSF
jgi:hypothetical protein